MLTLNGSRFAPMKSAPDEREGTVGLYRAFRKSIKLFNFDHEPIGVINAYGVLGSASKLADGRIWYSYATVPGVGEYASFSQSVNEPRDALRQLCGWDCVSNQPVATPADV